MDRTKTIIVAAGGAIGLVLIIALALTFGTQTVKVSETDAGAEFTLKIGDELQVTLAGNPTTGYIWTTAEIDEAVLEQVGDPEFDPDTDLLGSPGVVTITYKAVGAGSTTLELEYGRVADTNPERTMSISVVVE